MKSRNLTIGARLFLGFGIVLLLVLVMGVVTYQQSASLWKNTGELYNYSMQVSKSTRDLKSDILSIQSLMKDIVINEQLKKNTIIEIDQKINDYEAKMEKSFELVYERYLGDKSDVDSAYANFEKWKVEREILVTTILAGDRRFAFNRFYQENLTYMDKMIRNIQVMVDSSGKRAEMFYLTAQSDKERLVVRLWIVIGIIFSLTLLISILLFRGIRRPLMELNGVANQLRKLNYAARSGNRSTNEIGVLATTMNNMAAKVEAELEVKEQASGITELILKENELRPFSSTLLHLLTQKTDSQIGALYFLNEQGTFFELYESIGMARDHGKSFSAQTKEGELGRVLTEKKIARISQIRENSFFVQPAVAGTLWPREIITIPISDGDRVVAIISLASLHDYSSLAIQLIQEIWLSLTARINGILAFQKIIGISQRLDLQNKKLEEQSSELMTQTSELKEYNIELELQKRQLDEANRLKSSFLSNMSHELRTPLNSVIALSGVLNRRLSGAIPEDEFKYLGIIEKNGKQLLALINDILDLSRIESGREEIKHTVFSVYDLVRDILTLMEPVVQEKGIQVVSRIDPGLDSIVCDRAKCRHILQNIIGNAIKFTHKGSVEIGATIEAAEIRIWVKDTGIGISSEDITYIFDEFRQADGRASRSYGGTGLGLAIAGKYATMLNGQVTVESQLGQGSTFTVILPAMPTAYQGGENAIDVPGSSSLPARHAGIGIGTAKGKKLLLVEDNESVIIQMKDILKEDEYVIQVANSGKEALEILQHDTPDAIILDLMMPEVDGFEVLRAIREVEATSHVPVLILSAKHVTLQELKFLKHNHIYQLIQKGDVNRGELLAHIRRMVAPPAGVTATLSVNPAEGQPQTHSILIIEDNLDNMETVKALLNGTYQIAEAHTGQEGVKKARELISNLILLDISLPGMDGIEVLKAIKEHQHIREIPIIALTAKAMKGDREELLAVGFDDYISKPIDSASFETTINQWLNGR